MVRKSKELSTNVQLVHTSTCTSRNVCYAQTVVSAARTVTTVNNVVQNTTISHHQSHVYKSVVMASDSHYNVMTVTTSMEMVVAQIARHRLDLPVMEVAQTVKMHVQSTSHKSYNLSRLVKLIFMERLF